MSVGQKPENNLESDEKFSTYHPICFQMWGKNSECLFVNEAQFDHQISFFFIPISLKPLKQKTFILVR